MLLEDAIAATSDDHSASYGHCSVVIPLKVHMTI